MCNMSKPEVPKSKRFVVIKDYARWKDRQTNFRANSVTSDARENVFLQGC